MNQILIIGIILVIAILIVIAFTYRIQDAGEATNTDDKSQITTNVVYDNSLFLIHKNADDFIGKDENNEDMFSRYLLSPKNDNQQLYDSLGPKNSNHTTVVIIPIFTALAYHNPGFYDYYAGTCDESCLTVGGSAVNSSLKYDYRSSAMANQVFEILGYDRISDADVHMEPTILKEYDRVILLHNEYVTREMFDAITSHPKVIYLYPNALHAEVHADVETSSITLIRGHGYPQKEIRNGFDWEHDNTNPYEYDKECKNWEFYEIDNGMMLNCYPENIIFSDIEFLQTIRDL